MLTVIQKNVNTMVEIVHIRQRNARDNHNQAIGDDSINLINKYKIQSYFADNDVCKTDKRLDCDPLCSKTCWSRHLSNNQYNGGDCTR